MDSVFRMIAQIVLAKCRLRMKLADTKTES